MKADDPRARDERDRRVKELFEKVLDASPREREAVLASDGATPSLQGEVRELVRREADLGDFLETSAGARILGASDSPARLAPGDEVADFEIVGVLGEGGGGVVYEAEQREPRRRVALKMLRPRSRAGDAMRGFRDEAADLARLAHPGVAHVYAAGIHDGAEPRPWIAMELVEGARSVVRFAREEALGREARLRLFLDVCAAVHHAHQKGVVHRDVKPGNVLVGADGRPKVVDFGVACGVVDDGRASGAVGTPGYASPEQLAGDGVDVRADVYGLGALLYELLTGTVPHDVDDQPVAEAARIKRDVPPPPPSARAPGIPPDLDAIVLRALAPDRDARYDSVAALADDVARFLADQPVVAYAGGARYQLGKFVRRRRAATAAIVGIAAALVVGAAVSVRFAVENAAARGLAERRSYVAEIAAAAGALRVNDVGEARRRLERAPAALRDWEWRHLASRLDVSAETATFPGRELWYGSSSRDGALAAVSGVERTAPSGRTEFVALVRRDGSTVREWRVHADAETSSISLLRPDGSSLGTWKSADISGVPSTALSPDGRRMIVGLNSGGMFAYDVAEERESPVVAAHSDRVIAVAFSPDGSRFATAGKDATARVWSAADLAPLRTFRGTERVISLAFDAAGRRLAVGCRDGTIHVFGVDAAADERVILGHEASVEGVSFSPDGLRLASVSRDRTVRLWRVADGAAVAVGRAHASNVRSVAFDPRGDAYVSASWDGTLRVWDARTGAEKGVLCGHESAVTAVAFDDAAPRLVSFARDGTIKRWNVERTDAGTWRGLRDSPSSLAFSPDGSRVAVGGADGVVSIVDARGAHAARTFDPRCGAVRAVGFLDAGTLALAGESRVVEVWTVPGEDGVAPTRVRRIDAQLGAPAMALVPGGRSAWLICDAPGLPCGLPTRVDLTTGDVTETRRSPAPARSIACDGRGGVAVGGFDGDVAYLPGTGGARSIRAVVGAVASVAFDDAGRRLVVAGRDGNVRVFSVPDLASAASLSGHSDFVYAAEFLPGGRRIVTVSRDTTVRIWDAQDGECVLALHEHGYPVFCVAVGRDGSLFATGAGASEDAESAVKIWAAPAAGR